MYTTMKINIVLILLFTITFCQAQTKVIAHKSHSGSTHTFKKAYQNNLFDINRSNFGLPGNRNIFVLDTIIAVNDSVTVLKMRESNVCYAYGTKYTDLKKSDFKSKSVTLTNHDVFNKKNNITFIKEQRKNLYIEEPYISFNNPIEKVVFIGFKK
jgi:hypothetical protein